jgi:hypothetical protein
MTLPNKAERRAIVDTHQHPIGLKLAAKRRSQACTTRKKHSTRAFLSEY